MHKPTRLGILHKANPVRQPRHLLQVAGIAGQLAVFRHRQDAYRVAAQLDLIPGIHQEIGFAAIRQGISANKAGAEIGQRPLDGRELRRLARHLPAFEQRIG
ncbi:hypothetical protein D3C76_1493050 [compost metagenome]